MAQSLSSLTWAQVCDGKMGDSWYGTTEAQSVADIVLDVQKNNGGWMKNDQLHKLSTTEYNTLKAAKGEHSCFDNYATTQEMRFLLKVYNATHVQKYLDAFKSALDLIITAGQGKKGGWGQYWPDPNDQYSYQKYITFNDDLMTNVMKMLQNVYEAKGEYAGIVDDATKARCKTAWDAAIQCVLNCQIDDNGTKAIWCAQHDPADFLPAEGRPHEMPSAGPYESSSLLSYLMSLKNPSEDLKTSIRAAVEWMKNHKSFENKAVENYTNSSGVADRRIVDKQGSNLWGRFIQIGGTSGTAIYNKLWNKLKARGKKRAHHTTGTEYYEYQLLDASYDASKAYRPIYAIYTDDYPELYYRHLYNYEDTPDATDKYGALVATSLMAGNRSKYQYIGSWPETIINSEYPAWEASLEESDFAGNLYDEEISPATYSSSTGATWNFSDGFVVTSSSGDYANGNNNTVKFASSRDYTITIPAGYTVKKVSFSGYDNYDGTDSYISKLNGTSYSSTQYVFPKKDSNGNATYATHRFDFSSNPITGSLGFRLEGKQTCLRIHLYCEKEGDEPVVAEPVSFDFSSETINSEWQTYTNVVENATTVCPMAIGDGQYKVITDGYLDGYTKSLSANTNPSVSSGTPTSGTYFKFTPTVDGTLKVAMILNAAKSLYVNEGTTSILSNVKITNGSGVEQTLGTNKDSNNRDIANSLASKLNGYATFDVTAGKTYYVYCAGSKLGLYGYTFTPSSSTPSTPTTVDGTETTPTAKTSNEDFVGLCYTVPGTYVGGQGNSSKAIKFNLRDDKIVINVNPNYTITGFTFTGNDNYADNGITISSVTVDGGSANVLGSSVTFNKDKSENSFTVSNINATQNITITAATPHDNQLNGTIVFTYKYNVQPLALQSSAKTSSRNGSVTLKFNNPMAAANGTATLNGKTLTADADGTSLKFVYTGLDYGQTYTFTVPAGALKDEFNQTYDQPISITVTTDARATVTKKGFDKIVSNGEELAAAIAAANSHGSERYRIFVKKGAHVLPTNGSTTKGTDGVSYPDPRTHLSGANVSIIGEDYATTSFTNITPAPVNNACPLEGIGNGDVLIIDKTATESYFQGVTIRTSMGDAHGRDIAVNDQSNKTIMKDVCLWGYQDTYVSNNSNGRFYFDGGVLRGRTDYLCGKGDVYYNKVTLQQVGTGGYLAVPSVPLKYGYIFNECYIKKETSDVTYYLGRPWGSGTPIALFINTKVDAAPIAAGWAEMSNGWPDRFAEYGTKTTSGTAVSTSGRKTTFATSHTNNPVLTATEAEYYSNMARIMGGTDGWDPTEYTEQCAAPTAQLSGSTLTWNDDSYASSWVVFKDGEYYANPITNSLALSEAGTYTVRAANAMGGLGEASTGVTYTDMSAGGAALAFTAAVQGGSNDAGSTVNQETHYYNNWGTSGWAAQAYIGFDINVPEGKQVKSATLKFTSWCGGKYDGRSVDVYLLNKANTTAFNTSNMSLSAANGTKVSTETDNRTESLKTVTLGTDAIAALNNVVVADATSRVIFQLGGAAAGATLYGYASAKAPTLVVEFEDIPVSSVIVSPANKTIEVDGTLQLYAQVLPAGADQSVTWRSSDETIAEVDATGKVTAKAIGTVEIYATAANGLRDYCVLTVVAKQSGGGSGTLQIGGTDASLKGTLSSDNLTYTESNTVLGNVTLECHTTSKSIADADWTIENSKKKYFKLGTSANYTLKISDTTKKITKIEVFGKSNSSTKDGSVTMSSKEGSSMVVTNPSSTTLPMSQVATTLSYYISDWDSDNGINIQVGNQSVMCFKITYETASTPTTITKHISSTGWASFVPEKSVVVPENVNVYYVKSNSYNSTDKTVTAVKIEAGTVIKGDGTNTYGYIVNAAEGNRDYQFEVSATDEAQTFSENILACGKNSTIPNNSLVFAYADGKSGFYALDNYDIKLPVGIVYLPAGVLGTTVGGAPRAVTISFDEATVISNPITKQFNNSFFNLSGQKVDANYKGIIIRNGRKYINK